MRNVLLYAAAFAVSIAIALALTWTAGVLTLTFFSADDALLPAILLMFGVLILIANFMEKRQPPPSS